jgi:hypothetical protein
MPRIKPGHIQLIEGYGEFVLGARGGHLASVAKNFLFAYKQKMREENNDPDLGLPPLPRKHKARK